MPPGPRLWRDPRGEGRFTELLYSCALFQLSRNRYILPRDASRASAVWPWIGVVLARGWVDPHGGGACSYTTITNRSNPNLCCGT
eukprot:COSAG06_NODE_3261_length_5600_cov_7.025995_7_plen_85_part_00